MTFVPRTPLDDWVKTKIGLPAHRQLDRPVLSAYQLERLRGLLAYVKDHSRFYRRRFDTCKPESLGSLRDMSQWPLTTADDLRKDPLSFLCVSHSAVRRVVTLPDRKDPDHPLRLFFSEADLELAVDFFSRGFSTQVAAGQRMLIMMPCRPAFSVGDLLARALSRLAVRTVAHGLMQSARDAVDAIVAHRVTCLVGIPSQIAALTRHRLAADIPGGQIRGIWLGTQNENRAAVRMIETFWDCPVFQHYGMDEMCPGGGVVCAARNGFHLREADLIIEIVDPLTGCPVEIGACGEVVVTTLTRQAMPLVRYRTGHFAALMREPCACGSILHRLKAVEPRADAKALQKGV